MTTFTARLVYCIVHDSPFGTMAEKVVVDRRRCVELPEGSDEASLAAAMNPAMSSWIALTLRAPIQPNQRVFVLGATGNAGRMAIQIAKLLGAGRVVGAGREIGRLENSGADEIVSLVGNPKSVADAIANRNVQIASFAKSSHATCEKPRRSILHDVRGERVQPRPRPLSLI